MTLVICCLHENHLRIQEQLEMSPRSGIKFRNRSFGKQSQQGFQLDR